MAPKLKLTYFNVRWTTEATRMLLKYGDIEFDDNRVEKKDWEKIKSTFPFGVLPVLEENGKVVGQSIAIARYIAKKVKLTGSSDWENLEIDAVVDTISDLKDKIAKLYELDSEDAKEKLKETLLKETVPYYFERLDAIAKENNGYLVGKKLTWADFYFVVVDDIIPILLNKNLINKYKNLLNVRKNVCELPAIKTWIETRPKLEL